MCIAGYSIKFSLNKVVEFLKVVKHVQVLLQYQSKSYYIIGQEVYYSIGRFYFTYIIGHLDPIPLSGVFYYIIGHVLYSIGRLLHYRLVQPSLGLIVALRYPVITSLPRVLTSSVAVFNCS